MTASGCASRRLAGRVLRSGDVVAGALVETELAGGRLTSRIESVTEDSMLEDAGD